MTTKIGKMTINSLKMIKLLAYESVLAAERSLKSWLMRRSCHNQSVEICVEPQNWLDSLSTFLFFAVSKKEGITGIFLL